MGNDASVFLLCTLQTKLQDSVKFQLETYSHFCSLSLTLFLNCSELPANRSLIAHIKLFLEKKRVLIV